MIIFAIRMLLFIYMTHCDTFNCLSSMANSTLILKQHKFYCKKTIIWHHHHSLREECGEWDWNFDDDSDDICLRSRFLNATERHSSCVLMIIFENWVAQKWHYSLLSSQSRSNFPHTYNFTHTHTHLYIYIYICIHLAKQRTARNMIMILVRLKTAIDKCFKSINRHSKIKIWG